jgi:drug/metabolite transporter (DMT)-like permease
MSRWLAYCLGAVLVWGVWGLVFAAASNMMPPLMVQVLTTVGLTPVAVGLLFSKNVWKGQRRGRGVAWGLATGLGGTIGTIALSQAFVLGGEASIVAPLTAMFPLVTLVLAVAFLHERLNFIQAIGIVVALVAIFLFSSVDGTIGAASSLASLTSPWMLSALAALTLFGIQGVTQKLSTNDISSELATICYWVVSVIAAGGILATQPFDWSLPLVAWPLVLGAGALMGVAICIGLAAYRDGKASIVTALIALYPVLTVALAIPILGESMNLLKGAAIGLAILAGLALTYEKSTAVVTTAASPVAAMLPGD